MYNTHSGRIQLCCPTVQFRIPASDCGIRFLTESHSVDVASLPCSFSKRESTTFRRSVSDRTPVHHVRFLFRFPACRQAGIPLNGGIQESGHPALLSGNVSFGGSVGQRQLVRFAPGFGVARRSSGPNRLAVNICDCAEIVKSRNSDRDGCIH